jgi:hypothetical protein
MPRRGRHGARAVLVLERLEGGAHEVVGVRGSQRLGDDVLHAERLEYSAHRAASDDAGALRGRAEDHLAGAVAAVDVVVQGPALAERDADQTALGSLGRLADRLRHLAGLAVAEADAALLVADDDEGGEAEAPAALHHLRDAVDVDELVHELAVALLAVFAAAAAPAFTFTCHVVYLSISLTRPAGPLARSGFGSAGRRGSARPAVVTQNSRPPSRAASATALTRP